MFTRLPKSAQNGIDCVYKLCQCNANELSALLIETIAILAKQAPGFVDLIFEVDPWTWTVG